MRVPYRRAIRCPVSWTPSSPRRRVRTPACSVSSRSTPRWAGFAGSRGLEGSMSSPGPRRRSSPLGPWPLSLVPAVRRSSGSIFGISRNRRHGPAGSSGACARSGSARRDGTPSNGGWPTLRWRRRRPGLRSRLFGPVGWSVSRRRFVSSSRPAPRQRSGSVSSSGIRGRSTGARKRGPFLGWYSCRETGRAPASWRSWGPRTSGAGRPSARPPRAERTGPGLDGPPPVAGASISCEARRKGGVRLGRPRTVESRVRQNRRRTAAYPARQRARSSRPSPTVPMDGIPGILDRRVTVSLLSEGSGSVVSSE